MTKWPLVEMRSAAEIRNGAAPRRDNAADRLRKLRAEVDATSDRILLDVVVDDGFGNEGRKESLLRGRPVAKLAPHHPPSHSFDHQLYATNPGNLGSGYVGVSKSCGSKKREDTDTQSSGSVSMNLVFSSGLR